MKRFLVGLLALTSLSSMAGVNDVGVIGPKGDVLLYYKDGNNIIVKSCDPLTVLGLTPAEARKNCEGKSNKIPVEVFKQSIRSLFTIDNLNVLKPLTPAEILSYLEGGPSSEDIEKMEKELRKINAFISAYGEENADLVKKEELVKALSSQKSRLSAISKINTEIEKTVNLICDQTKLTLTKFSSDKYQFLYTVLKQYDPNQKFPCGLKGSVAERIKDCSYQESSSKEGFVLVTRTNNFKEVHKETKTGLLWSDRLPSPMNRSTHFDAEIACNSSLKEVAGISGVNWRLPSIEEYKEANKNGIKKALPNMNSWFWSSTVKNDECTDSSGCAWLFVGSNGSTGYYGRSDYYGGLVRCVAIDK